MQAPPIATGTLLQNRYRLVGVADHGNFGQTYLARDLQQGNELFVLKEFLPPDAAPETMQSLWQQFNQFAAVLYQLQHPQLPQAQALIAHDQRFYWMREYVEGESYGVLLEDRRAAGQAFTELEVLQLMAQVLPILHYLHSRGVVHRNVTPASLIQREVDGLPVLVNFGLVYELVAQLGLHQVDLAAALGKWGYASPEQVAGTPCPASDLFALAVTAIVLLSGKLPEELYDTEAQVFEWEASVAASPAFKQLLWQMLNPNPQKRPATAMEVMPILRSLMAQPSQSSIQTAVSAGVAPAIQKKRSREPQPRSRGSELTASMLLGVGLSLLFLVVAWRAFSSLRSLPFLSSAPTQPAVTNASPKPNIIPEQQTPAVPAQATPTPAASVATNSDGLRDRRRELEIDYNFFTQLVDQLFYAKYPQLQAQQLGAEAQQAALKTEWNAIANSLMERLAQLPPATRRKLGSYRRDDYTAWLAQLGESGTASKTLDPLADARFYQLFPEMQGKPLPPRTFGQIWYAIAEEQLPRAKTQKVSGRVQPASEQAAIN